MQLDFTPEQDALRDAVRTVLDGECTRGFVREIAEGRSGPDSLWRHMVDLGWPGLAVPEEHGGLGFGAVETAVVLEELGRAIAPGPYVATVTQFAPVVREAGTAEQRARWLGPVANGDLTGGLALAEAAGSTDPGDVETTIEADGETDRGTVVVRGTKHFVLDAPTATELVVVGRRPGTSGDDGVTAVVVPAGRARVEVLRTFDATRPVGTVHLDGVRVDADRVLGGTGRSAAAAVRRAVEEATVALALETVGTCQTIFDVTLDYAMHREQFGVPIGSFQAIKHKFADMLVALERARATGYFAALTIAEDDPRRSLATSMAKAAAGDAQRLLATEGIQIHAGIGYTWEHDMHLFVRRAKANAALFGTAAEHRARVADAIGL
ncbi:MAG: acyl-CoA dehydrogenase family protein [Acidimicrobiia bacterium]